MQLGETGRWYKEQYSETPPSAITAHTAYDDENNLITNNVIAFSSCDFIYSEYGEYIIGRMGIPYRQREINIISVAIDAPQDVISALSGKIGNLKGISAKTVLSNVKSDE